jgi:hypothetical protein
MPRIPQGNFDPTPSMDVPSAKIQQIEPVASTALRRLGSEAIQISKAWENANMKAEALGGVNQAESEVDTFEDEVKKLSADSVRGKLSDGKSFADTVNVKLEKMRVDHAAKLKDNPTSVEMYNQIVMPKMQSLADRAVAIQTGQVRDGALEDLDVASNNIAMKSLTQDVNEKEFHAFRLKAMASADVIGREAALSKVALLDKTVAMSAHKRIEYEGWSSDLEAKVRRTTARGNLTEGERAAANFALDKSIKVGQEVARNKADREHKGLMDSVGDDTSKYMMARTNFKQVLDVYTTVPLAPYETQEERNSKINDVTSTIVAHEVAAKHGGIFYGKDQASDDAKIESMLKDASQIKQSLFGTRQPANADMDKVIARKLLSFRNKVQTRGGALAVYQSHDPMYVNDMNSGDNSRISAAITRLNSWYDANDVASHNRTLPSLAESEMVGKMFGNIAKGDADPSGGQVWGFIKGEMSKYGEYAPKVFQDHITFGGGTKAGTPAVPPIVTMAPFIADDSSGMELMAAYNRREDLSKDMTDFKAKRLDSAIESGTDVMSISNARLGNNDAVAQGYKEAIKVLALQSLRDQSAKGDSLDYADAVESAKKKLSKNITIVKNRNSGAILVPTQELAAKGYSPDDLSTALENSSSFVRMGRIGQSVDWSAMNPSQTGKGTVLSTSIKRIMAETDPVKQAELADSLLGNNLMVVNDPENPRGASVYLKAYDSAPIPVVTTKNGKPHRLSIDFFDAIEKDRELDNTKQLEEFVAKGSKSIDEVVDDYMSRQYPKNKKLNRGE